MDQRARVVSDSESQTFIVRLRRERGTPAGEWRGQVEHVQSARLAHFADQAALLSFVWSQLAEIEPPTRSVAPVTRREPSGEWRSTGSPEKRGHPCGP
jgi:hypothetical protein